MLVDIAGCKEETLMLVDIAGYKEEKVILNEPKHFALARNYINRFFWNSLVLALVSFLFLKFSGSRIS